MKLLFDNNLSQKLVNQLNDLYPDSNHVALLDLDKASDKAVWQYAKDEAYCLISKDSDFNELLASNGFPPKIIWIRLGNCTSNQIVSLLKSHHQSIEEFFADHEAGILELQ
jgi:predicted nuclease of predicted toxin-antitoxin system